MYVYWEQTGLMKNAHSTKKCVGHFSDDLRWRAVYLFLQLVFRDCLHANTEYSWWLTYISDNQSTFGARVKCCFIYMALFSMRNFSYRVHKQQFVWKRRASDVSFIVLIFHIISFIHSMVSSTDMFTEKSMRKFIFGRPHLE